MYGFNEKSLIKVYGFNEKSLIKVYVSNEKSLIKVYKSFVIYLFFSIFAAKFKELWKDILCKTSLHGRTEQTGSP